jgi:hypothetical protein
VGEGILVVCSETLKVVIFEPVVFGTYALVHKGTHADFSHSIVIVKKDSI